MKKKTLKITASRGDLGFTAIEIAMVAAVIAILSLIVLPIFRNRVEDAKIAAAQADLSALMKAQQVVKADIDAYARLEDLDNVELNGYLTFPPNGVDKEVPFFQYVLPVNGGTPAATRQLLTQDQREVLAGVAEPKWRGPYIAFQNSLKYEDIRNPATFSAGNLFLRSQGAGGPLGQPEAPIQDFPNGQGLDGLYDSDENRYPVDPWGNPYMFFPPNGNNADPSTNNGEYSSAAIYSLGPNGLPGDGTGANNAADYTRSNAIQNPGVDTVLGKGDDLMVEF